MSKITDAARGVAEAERDHDFAEEAATKTRSVACAAFDRLQEAQAELGAAVREQMDKARAYVNGADAAGEAPEECCEEPRDPDGDGFDVDLGEIQLMPPVPHIEIHVHGPRPRRRSPVPPEPSAHEPGHPEER
jgi:hypothetical protein